MASYSKSVSSNQGTQSLSPGGTAYVSFNLPSAASFSSKSISLSFYVGSGTMSAVLWGGTTTTTVGAELSFYVSFNGGGYTELEKNKSYKPGSGSYSPNISSIAPASFSSCTVMIKSRANYNAYNMSASYGTVTVYSGSMYVASSITSCSVSSLQPSSGTFPISQSRVFSWSVTSPGYVTAQRLYYRLSTASSWSSVGVPASTTSYTFGGNTFSGYYYWYVSITDSFGNSVSSSTAGVTFGKKPKVSIKFPSSSGIWRTRSNEFRWEYNDDLNLYQKKWELSYKLTPEETWQTITGTNQNTTYTFAANYFQYAKYNLRIRVQNEDNLWSDYDEVTFQSGSVPKLSITSPANNAMLRNCADNTINWSLTDSLETGQKSFQYRYRLSNGTTWTTVSKTTSNQYYTISSGTLNQGKYVWQVKVQNGDGNWTDWSTERTFSYGVKSTIELLSPADGDTIRLLAPTVVSWSSSNDYDLGQSKYELEYKKASESTWTKLSGTTSESYTLASGFLTYNFYNFRLRIYNVDNIWSDYVYFNCQVGSTPKVEITYPTDCTIKLDASQTFTWILTDTLTTGQKSFEFGFKEEDEEEWTVVTQNTSNEYYSFGESQRFGAGNYQWRIRVTNNDGITTNFVYADFVTIGQTPAPVITNITQSAIPTFTWTTNSQDTFEFELYQNNERIYTSGVQKGYQIRSFTPNIMIDDGSYVIKMRCMNEYGYFTEWLTYAFVLSTDKPEALTCYIFANKYHGVDIARSLELDPVEAVPNPSTSPTPDAYYVLRRINGETKWDIIGKLSTSDETVKYTDNTVQKNVEYEYAIRNYKEEAGYTDSVAHLIMIRHKGIIVYDGNDFVNLTLSEDTMFDISHTPNKSFSYAQMIGRTYPVRESSEWMTHETVFNCFATVEQYDRLQEMMASNHELWFKGKDFSFACAIDSISIKNAQLEKGYDISIKVSRINEEDFALI